MAKRKPNPFAQQAQDLTLVRYGPELSALTALIRQAQTDRTQSIDTAKSTAALIQNAVDQARPVVRQNYRDASKQAAAAQAVAAPAIAAAGSPYAAAAALEQQGFTTRLGESRTYDLNNLQDRRVAAREGAAYAQTAANRTYNQTRQQIGQRVQDLAQEEGAYTSSTLQQLLSQDATARATAKNQNANRTQQERDALIGQGIDPDTGRPIPGAKGNRGSTGIKWATQKQQSHAADTIQAALKEAHTLKASGASRSEVEQMVLNGVDPIDAKPVYRTVTRNGKTIQQRVLNPDGSQKMTSAVPGIKAINENLYVQAALDLAYQGHLSKRTQNLLHARRIQIGPLGVTTYGDYLKRLAKALNRGPQGRVTPLTPGPNGQLRPT